MTDPARNRPAWRRALWAAPVLLLSVAAAAAFAGAIEWGPLDFAAAAVLLFGTVAGVDGAMRLARPGLLRIAAAVAVLAAGAGIWAGLAVG